MIKKWLIGILFTLIVCRLGTTIYSQKTKYVSDYWTRFGVLRDVYGSSQYVMKGWKYWIPDETVYSYAAGAYIQGANPIIVEPTQPPLGKYLIALSVLATGNENIAVAVFYVLLIAGIYVFSYQMTRSVVVALLVTLSASCERLFSDQLSSTPLLDIFHITFILFGLICASMALDKKKPVMLLLSFMFLGMSLMIKVWLVGTVFVIPLTLYIFIRYPSYKYFVFAGLGIMLLILLFSYTRMFQDGYSLIQVLKVQKWLYWYQAGKQNRLFLIWPLIFANRWYVWWGESPVSFDPNWSVSWPIMIGTGLLASFRILTGYLKKANSALLLSSLSIPAYCIFISMGQPSARYLLPILPICYCLAGWAMFVLVSRFKQLKKIV